MAIGRQIGLRTQLKNYDDRCVAVGNREGMINYEFYESYFCTMGSDPIVCIQAALELKLEV